MTDDLALRIALRRDPLRAGRRVRPALAAAALAFLIAAAPPPGAALDVDIGGLRSSRGVLLVCLTRDAKHFPDCGDDPAAFKLRIAASEHVARFTGLPDGTYALSLIHDENGNGKLDTRLGIPVEGVAFSRNPRLMFGPPSFAAARFAIGNGTGAQALRMKYFF